MTAAAAPQSAPLSLPSHFWADLSTRDFAALQHSGQADQVVAVLPVAAVEQHGPPLPLSVDATLLQGVIDAALPQLPADLPVLFLPSQNVGLSPEHIRFPGTLTLSPAQEHRFGIHAGEIETSMMLHLAPGTVHMEHARDFRSTSQDRSERYAILGNGKSAK